MRLKWAFSIEIIEVEQKAFLDTSDRASYS